MRFTLLPVALAATFANAITLDVSSTESVKAAASVIVHGMMSYYTGNLTGGTPGLLPDGYYWWEAGAMFGSLIDYWYYTGDDTYNTVITQAMQFQVGPDENYMPPNQSRTEGNDDQGFWGMAAMSAAEVAFPNPPSDDPQWLALAQAVFNTQATRWDTSTCQGGLRWQIYTFNNGYDYKNAISNGCFFNLAARLGAYTGNQSYFDWANRAYAWVEQIGFIDSSYQVWDGADTDVNCTDLSDLQWTYNVGVYLYGAAVMWNQTTGAERATWYTRVSGILTGSLVFFKNGVMYEAACEPVNNCDTDQQSFKAYLSRWMAATTKVAPWTYDTIMPLLESSAEAAALSCSGGRDGVTCGTKWTTGSWDGTYGVGQQMCALEVIQSNLISQVNGPLANGTGAISVGDPAAGLEDDDTTVTLAPITTADRAGAGILTILVLTGFLGGICWMAV